MAGNCYDKELVLRDGVSQEQRGLAALASDYVKVDERTTEDLLIFAKKYGFYLNYYDLTNTVSGDWQDFMSRDSAVIIAAIADWNAKDYTKYLKDLFTEIQDAASDSSVTDADVKQKLKFIFDFIFSLAIGLDNALKLLPADISYTEYLGVAINSALQPQLSLIWNYYIQFVTLIDNTATNLDTRMPVSAQVLIQDVDPSGLSMRWARLPLAQLGATDAPQITSIDAIAIKDKINQLITHRLFTGPIDAFIDAVSGIVDRSPVFLKEVLEHYPSHTPHYALFLSFIRLFRFAQDHQNEYTQRHLDFYYKEVLRLKNKAAEADFVHLVFELQKNSTPVILSRGMLFGAGKDSNKNDLYYGLTDNVTIQSATVKSIKSLYLTKTYGNESAVLFASSQANTDDGQGAPLVSADRSWHAFGDSSKIKIADVGFAVTSNSLFLNDGERMITFTVTGQAFPVISKRNIGDVFSVSLTGSKKWLNVVEEDFIDADASYFEVTATKLSIVIKLKGNTPPIVPYAKKIHGGDYAHVLPMAKLMLNPASFDLYQQLKVINVSTFTIDVQVDFAKNLVLQNDNGKIDASKPFKPFGEFPSVGSSFIIGSKEIFSKPLTELVLKINWTGSITGNVHRYFLNAGKWLSASGSSPVLSGQNASSGIKLIDGGITPPVSPADFAANENYKVTSVDGFAKIVLGNDDYSILRYQIAIQNAIAQDSVTVGPASGTGTYKITPSAILPPPPPAPVANDVSISYHSREVLFAEQSLMLFKKAEDPAFAAKANGLFNKRKSFLYHIEPFGFREIHPMLMGAPVTALPHPPDDNLVNMLPLFNLDNGKYNGEDKGTTQSPDNGGELWLGLENAIPGQSLSLLLQVAEGTASPLKMITGIRWYYLSNNNWVPFLSPDIIDRTKGLTVADLVTIRIPPDATTDNTRADAGLLWLKLVADHDTDAICKLLDVHANVAKAQFVQDPAKSISFSGPIAAKTISKPLVSNSSIKKTEQPYPSFGGYPLETDKKYYVRVSERLRHKHRAITSWDYERLVLDKYPQVHKVKCLNHTGFIVDPKSGLKKYSEVLAGHVMVVPLPDISHLNTTNRLLPYTSLGLLNEIQEFLYGYTSPHVQLHVCNPQFEQVQLDFKVKYIDTNNYDELLNNSIEKFLSPWAFENENVNDIKFGGAIERSVLLNFIEKQPYVDFVSCFKMFQYTQGSGNTIARTEVEEAMPATARSIIVSYYDEILKIKHIINSSEKCDCNE